MELFSVLAISLFSVSAVFALTRQFQMLQQNSYFPSRYLKWLKGNYAVFFLLEALLGVAFVLFYRFSPFAATFFAAIMILYRTFFAYHTQKKSIKRLVFTARVKRLYGAAILLFALLICLTVFVKDLSQIFLTLSLFFAIFPPVMALFCRMLTAPLDKMLTNWYINDAKRMLKERPDLLIIGITGSYGKTSTKFILSRILSEKYNVLATPGSYNTPMGVVRTIREKLLPQTQVFICEMGAKNVGDIKEICDIVSPKYGIITSVGAQHLDTFRSVDRVFRTKFELASAVLKNGGEVFVNGDSKELFSRINPAQYTVYGTGADFDFTARNILCSAQGSTFALHTDNDTLTLTTKLLGMHNIENLVGAAALALRLGVSEKEIAYAAAALKPTEHRLELKPYVKGSVMIDDAYNANPEGSLGAVRVLASFEGMKKVIITPGLIELGKEEYDANFRLGAAAGGVCDYIILVGKNRSRPLFDGAVSSGFSKENLFVVSSFREAVKVYTEFADSGTVVLVENDLPDNYLY